MKQTQKVCSIINIGVYLIVILCLLDILQKPLIGYFKYLEELSPESFNGSQNRGEKGKRKKKSLENMLFIFFPSYFEWIIKCRGLVMVAVSRSETVCDCNARRAKRKEQKKTRKIKP